METILALAVVESDGTLGKPGLEAVTAAQEMARQMGQAALVIGLIGDNPQPAANQLAHCGAARFLAAAGPDFAVARYGTDAAAAEALARAAAATVVVAPGTARVNRFLPGVAHRLQGRADTHVTGLVSVEGKTAVTRWYYRQRMEAVLHRAARPWLIAVDPGCFAPWNGPAGQAALENVPLTVDDQLRRTRVLGVQEPAADAQTIRPEAGLLFVTGAGWTKKQADGQTHVKEAEIIILDFLKHTRASLGSSKSLVDLSGEGQQVLSFLTHLNQIGQTGSTPRHPKGLATCCHGEEPHAVGWRFISERRAVNLDPNCGWARGKADVLYVADAFAVMRKVNELLAAS